MVKERFDLTVKYSGGGQIFARGRSTQMVQPQVKREKYFFDLMVIRPAADGRVRRVPLSPPPAVRVGGGLRLASAIHGHAAAGDRVTVPLQVLLL